MKVIIAGSRTANDFHKIIDAVEESMFKITEVVSGGARGADKLGEQYAKKNNLPVKKFPADWEKYGKSAGYKRNHSMANYADALIAIWDGESKGTKHMIDIANELKMFVYIKII